MAGAGVLYAAGCDGVFVATVHQSSQPIAQLGLYLPDELPIQRSDGHSVFVT